MYRSGVLSRSASQVKQSARTLSWWIMNLLSLRLSGCVTETLRRNDFVGCLSVRLFSTLSTGIWDNCHSCLSHSNLLFCGYRSPWMRMRPCTCGCRCKGMQCQSRILQTLDTPCRYSYPPPFKKTLSNGYYKIVKRMLQSD